MHNDFDFIIKRNRELNEADIIRIHDAMLTEYGWIPLEDMMNMPMPMFWNLVKCISDRREKENSHYKRTENDMKRGRR